MVCRLQLDTLALVFFSLLNHSLADWRLLQLFPCTLQCINEAINELSCQKEDLNCVCHHYLFKARAETCVKSLCNSQENDILTKAVDIQCAGREEYPMGPEAGSGVNFNPGHNVSYESLVSPSTTTSLSSTPSKVGEIELQPAKPDIDLNSQTRGFDKTGYIDTSIMHTAYKTSIAATLTTGLPDATTTVSIGPFAKIPACATSCVRTAIQKAPCSNQLDCLCNPVGKFISDISKCDLSACTDPDPVGHLRCYILHRCSVNEHRYPWDTRLQCYVDPYTRTTLDRVGCAKDVIQSAMSAIV